MCLFLRLITILQLLALHVAWDIFSNSEKISENCALFFFICSCIHQRFIEHLENPPGTSIQRFIKYIFPAFTPIPPNENIQEQNSRTQHFEKALQVAFGKPGLDGSRWLNPCPLNLCTSWMIYRGAVQLGCWLDSYSPIQQ